MFKMPKFDAPPPHVVFLVTQLPPSKEKHIGTAPRRAVPAFLSDPFPSLHPVLKAMRQDLAPSWRLLGSSLDGKSMVLLFLGKNYFGNFGSKSHGFGRKRLKIGVGRSLLEISI